MHEDTKKELSAQFKSGLENGFEVKPVEDVEAAPPEDVEAAPIRASTSLPSFETDPDLYFLRLALGGDNPGKW